MDMKGEPSCPRCGRPVHPPGLWSSDWQCDLHGQVHPLQPVVQPTVQVLADYARRAAVPVWVPWPLPQGWVVTGAVCAGDDRSGGRATVVACSGPAPLGGAGELFLVAEEPGVGLGARLAGLPGPDPGGIPLETPPHAKVHSGGHPTALWVVDGPPDRAVYVGEASACWLWAVFWPAEAGALLLEDLGLADVRDLGHEIDLVPVGALCPRLAAAASPHGKDSP